MKKILSIIFVSLVTATTSFAQTVWHNPLASASSSYLQNQGWNEDGATITAFRIEQKVRCETRCGNWRVSPLVCPSDSRRMLPR